MSTKEPKIVAVSTASALARAAVFLVVVVAHNGSKSSLVVGRDGVAGAARQAVFKLVVAGACSRAGGAPRAAMMRVR